MINKENLFIGCWVHVPCLVDEVEGIDGNRRIRQLYDYDCDVEGFKELKYSEIEPIPITPDILEENGFIKDGYTNLSPDYFFSNDECYICVNLRTYPCKVKQIWGTNSITKYSMTIEEDKTTPPELRRPLYVHELQQLLQVLGVNKEIVV